MIRKLADLIVDELSGLNFVNQIGGVVRPVEINKMVNNESDVKIYPAITNPTTKKHDLYIPDSSKKSIIYFEDNGIVSIDNDTRYTVYEANLRMICWYNLPQINEDYLTGDLLTQTLIANIPHELPNTDYLTKIFVEFTGEAAKDKSLFASYDYDEAEWQYLNYPYDYAALDFVIEFSVPRNIECFEEVTINPKVC